LANGQKRSGSAFFFYGSTSETLGKLGDRLLSAFPALRIARRHGITPFLPVERVWPGSIGRLCSLCWLRNRLLRSTGFLFELRVICSSIVQLFTRQ
jgi:hypothetical protein